MKKIIIAGCLLLAGCIGVAYAAGGLRGSFWVAGSRSASQPTGTQVASLDRIWFSSVSGHAVHTDTSNVDHDLESASSGYSSTATAALTWSMVQYAVVNTASSSASSITYGVKMQFTQPVTVLGINAYWVGGFGALSLKCSIWDTGGTRLANQTVSVNAAGAYVATFGSPVTISAANTMKDYFIGCWETSGGHYTFVATTSSRPGGTNPTIRQQISPWYDWLDDSYFVAGDAKPTTSAGIGQYMPVEPVFTAP